MFVNFYKKKPVIIKAVQWKGNNLDNIKEFVGDSLICRSMNNVLSVGDDSLIPELEIKTLEGKHICSLGDYIIQGIKGEFYPCKPDIFKATYEECSAYDI